MIGGVKYVVVNEGQEESFLQLFRTLKAEMTRHACTMTCTGRAKQPGLT